MNAQLTILADNKAEEPYISEHGFSVLIEMKQNRLLFDTGQGETLFFNSEKMNISLSPLDALILSHGHYDHGGGIKKVLYQNPQLHLYAHPNYIISRWTVEPGKKPKPAGLPEKDKNAISGFSKEQLHWCKKITQIVPNLWVTGEIPRKSDFEDTGGPFFEDKYGEKPDLISDDMSVWIEGEDGLTVICGCCHSGLKNTLEHIRSHTDKPIQTLIGGFHLLNANENRLSKTALYLNELGIERIFPAHCTGDNAVSFLKRKHYAQIQSCAVGLKRYIL